MGNCVGSKDKTRSKHPNAVVNVQRSFSPSELNLNLSRGDKYEIVIIGEDSTNQMSSTKERVKEEEEEFESMPDISDDGSPERRRGKNELRMSGAVKTKREKQNLNLFSGLNTDRSGFNTDRSGLGERGMDSKRVLIEENNKLSFSGNDLSVTFSARRKGDVVDSDEISMDSESNEEIKVEDEEEEKVKQISRKLEPNSKPSARKELRGNTTPRGLNDNVAPEGLGGKMTPRGLTDSMLGYVTPRNEERPQPNILNYHEDSMPVFNGEYYVMQSSGYYDPMKDMYMQS